ncbi:hypothetical protein C8R46DRAFT_1186057 [Mycena filopes]|nr:hypothetical protein C8R46DRAFT_1186057 [Mycena filopes]
MAEAAQPDFYEVTLHTDGTLTCNCPTFGSTGKTCEHTFGVNLELEFGNVEAYNELETIRKIRGKAANGEKNNPEKDSVDMGRRAQRRSDRAVEEQINPWDSDDGRGNSAGSKSDDSDGNAEGLGVDDPLTRTASQLSKGRSPATTPLHPSRTAKPRKSKGKQLETPVDDSKHNGPVRFSNPTGPKTGLPSSLLPGASPAKKAADEEKKRLLAAEFQAERQKERDEKAAKKAERKVDKQRKKAEEIIRLTEREAADQAEEVGFFAGVDDLGRWGDELYQMREDEGQGFTDIALALSACIGSGVLIIPSYFSRLAEALRTVDWGITAATIIQEADTAARADTAKANLIDPAIVLFLHRDEDEHGREHWLLFRYGQELECFDPLGEHQKIYNRKKIVTDMHTIAAYFNGEDLATSSLRKLRAPVVKDFLKEIWTSWRIGEEGLEEAALNRFLKPFKVQHSGPMGSCIASRPSWISRAEEVIPKKPESKPLSSIPKAIVPKKKKRQPEVQDSGLDDGVDEDEHAQTVTHLKYIADDFCLRLAGAQHKIIGCAGPLYLEHLHRISELTGWLSMDIISEWAEHLDVNITLPDTKVLQVGFFNAIRDNCKHSAKDEKKLEAWWRRFLKGTRKWFKIDETRAIILPIHVPSHWICAFVDFDHKYLAVFDSWERNPVVRGDWEQSDHAPIFHVRPKPNRVQKFRYIMFSTIMKLPTAPIEKGDNQDITNDSDVPIGSPPVSDDESEIEVSSPRPITPTTRLSKSGLSQELEILKVGLGQELETLKVGLGQEL